MFDKEPHWRALKQGLKQLAHQEIMPRFMQVLAEEKQDGSLLTEADMAMQHASEEFLRALYPQYDFLGEESSDEQQQAALKSAAGCWILDPIDGTSNFVSGIPVFVVSLALVVQGEIVLGLVYDPNRDELFAARKGLGAELNDQILFAQTSKKTIAECIGLIDFKRLPKQWAQSLAAAPPFASQRSIGSVSLDWCWIAAGRGQIYCHGAQNIWDYAAGWLILLEAGGSEANFEGGSVYAPRVEKRSALAATTPELFQQWQAVLAKIEG